MQTAIVDGVPMRWDGAKWVGRETRCTLCDEPLAVGDAADIVCGRCFRAPHIDEGNRLRYLRTIIADEQYAYRFARMSLYRDDLIEQIDGFLLADGYAPVPQEEPTLRSLIGSVPNLTGGVPAEEWVRAKRDAPPEAPSNEEIRQHFALLPLGQRMRLTER